MSSQKGNTKRTRPQKYQNSSAFRNDLHDKTRTIQMINNLVISGVCAKCKDCIEWKIKYKKYKPLSQPRTCVKCQQKVVKMAYYIMCQPCATERSCCAKCGENQKIVHQAPPTTAEASSQYAEFQRELRGLSEKKRRKFLRLLAEGKLSMEDIKSGKHQTSEKDDESEPGDLEHNQTVDEDSVSDPESTHLYPSSETQPEAQPDHQRASPSEQSDHLKQDMAAGGESLSPQ